MVPLAGCNRTAADAHLRPGEALTSGKTGEASREGEAPAEPPSRSATTTPATTQETLRHLASDEMEGRGVGTKGLDRAAEYIAAQFERDGLEPLPGFDGYFQRFEMTTGATIASGTKLNLAGDALGQDKSFRPLSFSASAPFDGPVAFGGYGISSEKFDYDDYAGIDVKGKVALVLRFEPHNEGGKSRFEEKGYSDEATFKQKARVAAERGAVALLVVNPPEHHGKDALLPFAGMFTEARAKIPVVQISIEAANALLKKGGADDLKALQGRIDSTGKPASTDLKDVNASGDIRIELRRQPVMNVAAIARGSGPLKDEYVVVGAHYDHVGKSRMFSNGGKEGEIHNGADDNGSGVAALLALARDYAARKPEGRSVIFVAFTAEEWGLIGSKQFVDHPPVPLEKVAAMINMDMVGRVRNETLYMGGTGTGQGLEAIVREADEASPLEVKDIGKGGFGPSDHMSFALKKIPVLFFFSGLHPDYHRPSDDVEKINFTGIDQVIGVAQDVIDRLATGPKQEYVAVADSSAHRVGMGTGGGGGGNRVSLGVVPDYTSAESTGGVRITGTVPGSPAEAAGLKDGDVIQRFGDKPIDDLYALSAALGDAKAGERVKLKLLRDGKEIEVEATLAERKE